MNRGITWQKVLFKLIPYLCAVGLFQILSVLIISFNYLESNSNEAFFQKTIIEITVLVELFLIYFLLKKIRKEIFFLKLAMYLKFNLKATITALFIGFFLVSLICAVLMVFYEYMIEIKF